MLCSTQSKKDLSELSELIDRLQEDLRIKQVSLDEANETLFVMEDSVEQHIAVKKHDNHIIQQLNNQISSLKVCPSSTINSSHSAAGF